MQLAGDETKATEASDCFAQLGSFSKLPVEIRLLIWDALFRLIPSTPLSHTAGRANTLSILVSSRYIYHEISHHLYTSLNHEIVFCPTFEENSWAVIELSSQKFDVRRNVADLKTLNRHIKSFPHCRAKNNLLRVSIPPSSMRDPGRIIKLSQTANYLVGAMKDLEDSPQVLVTLTGNWFVQGYRRESIHYKIGRHIVGGRPDTHIVLVPFCRLRDWSCDLPLELWIEAFGGLVPGWFDGVKGVPVYKAAENLGHPIWSDIDTWLMDIRMFLDKALDDIRGPTADYLRRERFRTWHEDGDGWISLYGEHLLNDLAINSSIVKRHDRRLVQAARRLDMMIWYHHLTHTGRKYPSLQDLKLAETWDSETWCRAWPEGIPPFSTCRYYVYSKEQPIIRAKYLSIIPKLEELLSELSWWASDVAPSV